jgi:ATP-dependent DNA helicase DinG
VPAPGSSDTFTPPDARGSRRQDLAARVAALFASGGALAEALEAFEPRTSQLAMAEAVAEMLAARGILLAEAGTGTGKTLAYLVPAILSGHRVLVSTGTKNLQDQIFNKDLPLLARVLPVKFTATCMKGRANYLCLHRFEQFRTEPLLRSDADRIHFTLIEEWAAATTTGDRAEIDELPDEAPIWGHLSATAERCLGSECPRFAECFVTRMRQHAAASDVTIVNHHLLCADAALRHHSFGEVIPEAPVLVIDEAHQLEDVATQYFGVAVSNYRLEDLVADCNRLWRAGAIRERRDADAWRAATVAVDLEGMEFFSRLSAIASAADARSGVTQVTLPDARGMRGRRTDGRGTATPGLFDARVRLSPTQMQPMVPSERGLVAALDHLRVSTESIRDASEDVRAIARRAGELHDELQFLLAADDRAFVYYVELRGAGVFLRASPVDVSSIVREALLDRQPTIILTSATLCIDGSYDYIRGRLGIREAREIRLPSEFDHATQSILYLPRRMPDPRAPDFNGRAASEIVEVLQRTEGRAFVLFTSYAALRAAEPIVSSLPYPLFVQGTAPRGVLLEHFRRTPNAVLLATSSFWQGVDVAGEALSCVIIDRLPFASPADPLVAARIDAITERGGHAFGEYQVPLAILLLQQGLGRLLRHRDDRGVLAILDPRLRTMAYGRRFLASLPPAPITRSLDDISRFFSKSHEL